MRNTYLIFNLPDFPKRGKRVRSLLFSEETKEEKKKRVIDTHVHKLNNYIKDKKWNYYVLQRTQNGGWHIDDKIVERLDEIVRYYPKTMWKNVKLSNFTMRRMRVRDRRVQYGRRQYEQTLRGFIRFMKFLQSYIHHFNLLSQ